MSIYFDLWALQATSLLLILYSHVDFQILDSWSWLYISKPISVDQLIGCCREESPQTHYLKIKNKSAQSCWSNHNYAPCFTCRFITIHSISNSMTRAAAAAATTWRFTRQTEARVCGICRANDLTVKVTYSSGLDSRRWKRGASDRYVDRRMIDEDCTPPAHLGPHHDPTTPSLLRRLLV